MRRGNACKVFRGAGFALTVIASGGDARIRILSPA